MKYLQKPYLLILTLLSYNLSFAEEIQSLNNDLDMTDNAEASPLNPGIDNTDWILPAPVVASVTLLVLGFVYIKSRNKISDLNSKIQTLEKDLTAQAQGFQSEIEQIERLQSEILKLRSTLAQPSTNTSLRIKTQDLFDEFGVTAIINFIQSHIKYHGVNSLENINSTEELKTHIDTFMESWLPKNDLIILSEDGKTPPIFSTDFQKFILQVAVEKAHLLETHNLDSLSDNIGITNYEVKNFIIDSIDQTLKAVADEILEKLTIHTNEHATNYEGLLSWIIGEDSLVNRLNQEEFTVSDIFRH
jgi:hypothetical protein